MAPGLLFPLWRLRNRDTKGKIIMLWTVFVVLMILWLLGMVSSYTLGGFIHILLVMAIAVVLINVINGRRPV
jgi:asparagine N-glycosylation enzyme membrane subunit Stt3